VNRVELLLHVVGSEEIGDTSQLEQKIVLKTKDGRRSNDGGLREEASSNLLGSALDFLLALFHIWSGSNSQTLVR
jgi:hypothetical protein